MENSKTFVGKTKLPRVECKVSLTPADLDMLRQYVTEKGQVHLTFVHGPSKSDWQKPSTWVEVYDPNASGEQKRVVAQTTPANEIPWENS